MPDVLTSGIAPPQQNQSTFQERMVTSFPPATTNELNPANKRFIDHERNWHREPGDVDTAGSIHD